MNKDARAPSARRTTMPHQSFVNHEAAGSAAVVGFAALSLATLGTVPLIPWLVNMQGSHALLATTHVFVCALGAAYAIRGRLRPCLLVASVFPYCWLVLPSIFQISHVEAAWGDPGVTLDYSATIRAQGVLLLGQVSLLVGYLAAATRRRPPGERWEVDSAGRSRLLTMSVVLLLGAIALVPLVIGAAGGVGALFTSRQGFNQALASGGLSDGSSSAAALVKIVPSSLATSAAVLALWLVRNRAPQDERPYRAKVVAAVAAALLLVVANPFAFTRYLVLACFGAVAMSYFTPRKQLAAVAALGASLVAFLLAYPAANFFRTGTTSSTSGYLLATPDFDGFQQTINTVNYVDVEGISWASHIVSGLFFFVPRELWSAKAVPSAFPVAQERGYNFLNLSMPLPSEAYLDLGWIGVVLILGLLGGAWATLDRGWLDQTRLAVLAAYVAVAQVGLWRGPFGSLVPIFGFTIGLLLVATVLSGEGLGQRSRRRRASLTP
ncbi:hypothetical protein [Nocardioides sp.]|uniref:hypothetical protein n=1 Tax=Nocardioides sp. TaxID=35761 RepID=UPI00286BD8EC|nr:hypothetical protein [Nocardioides sp.]